MVTLYKNSLRYVNVECDQARKQGCYAHPQTLANCTGITVIRAFSNSSGSLHKASVSIPVVKITRESRVRRVVTCDSTVRRFLLD